MERANYKDFSLRRQSKEGVAYNTSTLFLTAANSMPLVVISSEIGFPGFFAITASALAGATLAEYEVKAAKIYNNYRDRKRPQVSIENGVTVIELTKKDYRFK